MRNLFRFFYANARDLKMQSLTVSEIAELMKPVNEQTLRLPRSFAHSMRLIIEANKSSEGYAAKTAASVSALKMKQ